MNLASTELGPCRHDCHAFRNAYEKHKVIKWAVILGFSPCITSDLWHSMAQGTGLGSEIEHVFTGIH